MINQPHPPRRPGITPDQFDALADLLRLRQGPSRDAARLVLVDGLPPSAAADRVGIGRAGVSDVLRRCRRGFALAERATGGCRGWPKASKPAMDS